MTSKPSASREFLSTPSARRATLHLLNAEKLRQFLSTPSARRATRSAASPAAELYYFYPRPPRGGRPPHFFVLVARRVFLSTPSARRATRHGSCACSRLPISIHALREEGDSTLGVSSMNSSYFYPRPPRGGRLNCLTQPSFTLRFLSTPSARRATQRPCCHAHKVFISIHALREEGDRGSQTAKECQLYFYPRPPRGGRPRALHSAAQELSISIHALREEGDGRFFLCR